MNAESSAQIGQVVKILKGKEAGEIAVVIAVVDSRFVYIADGGKRKFDSPKKKNILHLELTPVISSEVVNSLKETGRVTNGKLRFAVLDFERSAGTSAMKKGE
ncbi:KOW domain-containing RNA-binding protein [Paenibacillus sp. HN-1]|uniref:KOW domain-containing RNA-binding protein n=1 Tax=Paenibacillus TaxID=44249 RepID=UPI001CA8AC77|nr:MULTISPECIES: KOW domain-containing RNA-binding protein [Paenibacillus]MBY9077233.1 KOW domain-containing RNA-binding protein [Paenibacillus sp. CGMCC 1.18879]MBY9083280.1 KOW domain-containing RNA-binding protein [Paenibacillus sinensis]